MTGPPVESESALDCKRSRTRRYRRVALATVIAGLTLTTACVLFLGRDTDLIEQRLRAELPPGAPADQIQRWLERNADSVAWSWEQTNQFSLATLAGQAGVDGGEARAAIWMALPGVADWDVQMRPHRMDLYVLLDEEYRVLGYASHTYPTMSLWKRPLVWLGRKL